jgi:hypothetical protein
LVPGRERRRLRHPAVNVGAHHRLHRERHRSGLLLGMPCIDFTKHAARIGIPYSLRRHDA